MRFKPFLVSILAALCATAAAPAFSQVMPAASEGSSRFAVGGGASNFNMDWARSRMYGITAWIDWHPGMLPSFLNGLSAEIEARDISFDRPGNGFPKNFRQDTAGGGAIYSWNRFRNFHPYCKGLISYGSFDFQTRNPHYSHDTRTLYSMGGGFDYRVYRRVWVRADYEYQVWQPLFSTTFRPDPQGFTLGAMYEIKGFRPR
jgi:opacity protein-like surface antigen